MKKLFCIQQGILAVCFSLLLMGGLVQAATLTVGRQNVLYQLRDNGNPSDLTDWQWKNRRSGPLTAATLRGHLTALGTNCFRELGRLILAQGSLLNTVVNNHNVGFNNNPNYMNNQVVKNNLPRAMSNLIDHLFDHGHMGYYPHAQAIDPEDSKAIVFRDPSRKFRGVFNVSNAIRIRIFPAIQTWWNNLLNPQVQNQENWILHGALPTCQGYAVDPGAPQQLTLRNAANNLIKTLFSSDRFNPINLRNDPGGNQDRFTIDATYHGPAIQGVDYQAPLPAQAAPPVPAVPSLGLKMHPLPNGVQAPAADYTNEIRIVVEVEDGWIRIVSLFPLG